MTKTNRSFGSLCFLAAVLPAVVLFAGCDGNPPPTDVQSDPSVLSDGTDSSKRHPDMAHGSVDMAHGSVDMAHGSVDMGHGGGDLGTFPSANPPPASCDQRSAGVTGIQVVVRVDEYQGLITGRNGTHEIVYGTIIDTPWVFDTKIVDTSNVQLAMNVASAKDSTGLPREVKVVPGQILEVEGEYIPAATASAHDAKGAAAVIHYSHTPCGYVTIAGTIYK